MIGMVERGLAADGLSHNTYLVFSSDNGLHAGQYRLMPGKLTAFDTDIRVPLVVVGPGVPAGRRTSAMSENIDLAATFAGIAGTSMPTDGHSLVRLIHGQPAPDWRDTILVEHHGGAMSPFDPDFQRSPSGNPNTYEAMRVRLAVQLGDQLGWLLAASRPQALEPSSVLTLNAGHDADLCSPIVREYPKARVQAAGWLEPPSDGDWVVKALKTLVTEHPLRAWALHLVRCAADWVDEGWVSAADAEDCSRTPWPQATMSIWPTPYTC